VTKQDFSLAKVFADLANDPNWPLDATDRLNEGTMVGILAKEKLKQARLALMVVDAKSDVVFLRQVARSQIPLTEVSFNIALEQLSINPSHYAIVKERVEQADTEEK